MADYTGVVGNFVSQLINWGKLWGIPIGKYVAEYGSTITISGSCYPEYDSTVFGYDCRNITEIGLCNDPMNQQIFGAEQIEDGSWVTASHCPGCGCETFGVPNFYELVAEEGNRKPVDEETDFLEELNELFN